MGKSFQPTGKGLILQTANLGDVVSSLVVPQALKGKVDDIDIFVRAPFRDLLESEDCLQVVEEETVTTKEYDFLIDLDSSQASRKLVKKISAREKLGMHTSFFRKLKYSSFYNHSVPKHGYDHIVKNYYSVLDYFGLSDQPIPQLSKNNIATVSDDFNSYMTGKSGSVALSFEASNPIRSLPQKMVCKIIEFCKSKNVGVFLIGVDENLHQEILRQTGNYPWFKKMSLKEIKALLGLVDLFIGADTGPIHVAGALGLKTIGIYGPNLPENYGQLSNLAQAIDKEFSCRPCNQNRPCPYERRCYNSIPVSDITHSLTKALAL